METSKLAGQLQKRRKNLVKSIQGMEKELSGIDALLKSYGSKNIGLAKKKASSNHFPGSVRQYLKEKYAKTSLKEGIRIVLKNFNTNMFHIEFLAVEMFNQNYINGNQENLNAACRTLKSTIYKCEDLVVKAVEEPSLYHSLLHNPNKEIGDFFNDFSNEDWDDDTMKMSNRDYLEYEGGDEEEGDEDEKEEEEEEEEEDGEEESLVTPRVRNIIPISERIVSGSIKKFMREKFVRIRSVDGIKLVLEKLNPKRFSIDMLISELFMESYLLDAKNIHSARSTIQSTMAYYGGIGKHIKGQTGIYEYLSYNPKKPSGGKGESAVL